MTISLEKCMNPFVQCFENVTAYETLEGPDFAWKITYEKESLPQENTTKAIYFILDANNQAAFSHWVYESATWLPFYKELQLCRF